MTAHSGTFAVPMRPPVAPALRPLLQAVVDSITLLGPAGAAACWRTVSRQIFIALADGGLSTPDARLAMSAAGATEDDLDRLGFWLLDSAVRISKGQRPQIPAPATVTIRLVRVAHDGTIVTQSFEADDAAAALKARGFDVGLADGSVYLRPELRSAPAIHGFAGPTWDGAAIRYEDRRSPTPLGL